MTRRRSCFRILFIVALLLALARVSRAQEVQPVVFDWRAYTPNACIVDGMPRVEELITTPTWDQFMYQTVDGKLWVVQLTYSRDTGEPMEIRILLNDQGYCPEGEGGGNVAKKLTTYQTRVLQLAVQEGKIRIDKLFLTDAQYKRLDAMGEAGLIDFRVRSHYVEYTATAAGRDALAQQEGGDG